MAVKRPERKMHLTDYLWVLKKRMLLILFFWVAVFGVVAVVTFMKKPEYRASAVMLIERSIYQPRVLQVGQGATSTEWYNSQFRLLRSRRIARKLYHDMQMRNWELFQRMGAGRDHIAVVQNWIRVTPYPKTHLVEIWMVNRDGRLAMDMVNRVTRAYRDIVQESKTAAVRRSLDALKARADELRVELQRIDRDITTLTADRGDIFAAPEIRSIVLTRQSRLQDAAAQAQFDTVTATSTYNAINNAIENGEYELLDRDDVLDSLRSKRYSVLEVIRLDQLNRTNRYRESDEFSRTLKVRLEEIDRQIAVEQARVQRGAISRAAQELATTEANRDVLDKMLADTREDIQRISRDMLKLQVFRKNQENVQAIETELRKAIETVKTFDQYDQTTATIVSEAGEPKQIYSPKYTLNLGLGAVVGLLVGIGAAFFFEYLNTTIRMPRDIEDGLGLPVLGFVPAMSSKLKDFATRSLISHLDSSSGPAEAFRGIRTEVMLRSDLRQVKTGMVTSTSPQEGKTTVAINWAITLAQAGNKVLLVDADLRKPAVHQAFNLTADKGLSTLLSEKDTATVYIKKTDIENLHVLPGGPVPLNPAELLGSRKMRTLVAEAAERYDSVIIDASPVLGVADANILSTMVDCVVLVVKASQNRRALVMRAKNQLASVNARLAGAVLNNVRGTKGDYYYYRQYYRPVAQMMEEAETQAVGPR